MIIITQMIQNQHYQNKREKNLQSYFSINFFFLLTLPFHPFIFSPLSFSPAFPHFISSDHYNVSFGWTEGTGAKRLMITGKVVPMIRFLMVILFLLHSTKMNHIISKREEEGWGNWRQTATYHSNNHDLIHMKEINSHRERERKRMRGKRIGPSFMASDTSKKKRGDQLWDGGWRIKRRWREMVEEKMTEDDVKSTLNKSHEREREREREV